MRERTLLFDSLMSVRVEYSKQPLLGGSEKGGVVCAISRRGEAGPAGSASRRSSHWSAVIREAHRVMEGNEAGGTIVVVHD
jgi:hypothetical protein